MNAIWKYTLDKLDKRLDIPASAKILAVHEQRGEICLWATVDPGMDRESRRFLVIGTGHDMPEGQLDFVGTVGLNDWALVFHVFEVRP